MSIFVLKEIDTISKNQIFKQLVIYRTIEELDSVEKDEKLGVVDLFVSRSQKVDISTLKSIFKIMDFLICNPDFLLNNNNFKIITPLKEKIIEFEIKRKNIRFYGIKLNNGKMLILYCGYKNAQKEDIIRFRSLKKQFLEQI